MGITEAVAAAMDGDDAIDFLGLGLEHLCEDGIGIGDSDEDLDLDSMPEDIMRNTFDEEDDSDAGSRYLPQLSSWSWLVLPWLGPLVLLINGACHTCFSLGHAAVWPFMGLTARLHCVHAETLGRRRAGF